MFVKPLNGLSLLNPETMRVIPSDEWTEVSDDFKNFWLRRQLDGDVDLSLTEPEPEAEPEADEPS